METDPLPTVLTVAHLLSKQRGPLEEKAAKVGLALQQGQITPTEAYQRCCALISMYGPPDARLRALILHG